ncbi:hypothetical protein FRB97_007352 [Tulasnella sp. 331]|nr:hypothetical protein FRB97_007352 [Tulasnella sp. 331]
MSQTNPRKASNGSGNGPPVTRTSTPPPTVSKAVRHPLPQHPHTHIPAHLKAHRGGRPMSKPSTPSVEESPEMKALRAKFGSQLATLKEIYSTWSDEDLLSALGESNGNVDAVAERISDGRVEQWGSVSSKKDKKDKERPFSSAGGHQVPSRDGAGSPGPGRGGFRGGRGGGFVGARGGRGGARSGGGGSGFSTGAPANGVWGKTPASAGNKNDSAPTPTAETPVEANGGTSEWVATAGDWASAASPASGAGETNATDTEVVKSVAPQPTSVPLVQHKPESFPSKALLKVPPAPPKLSWAQIAKPKPKPVAPIPAPAPPAPLLIESSQPEPVAEPSVESLGPAVQANEDNGPNDDDPEATQEPSQEPVAEEVTTYPSQEEVQTAPQDDWIVLTPPKDAAVELPPTAEVADEPVTPVEAPAPAVHVEETVAPPAQEDRPAPVSAAQIISPTHPPGLSAVPSLAPTPSLSSTTSTSAPTAIGSSKPATPRMAHRASAKYKTSDAAVVMPGGGIPSTSAISTWSFGNLAPPSDVAPASGAGRFGMQFGSLTLNDDGDDGLDGPPAPEPVQEVKEEQVPVVIAPAAPQPEPVPAPTVIPQAEPQPQPIPSPAPSHVQQAQQQQQQQQPRALDQEPEQPHHQPQRPAQNGTTLSAINNLFQQAQHQQSQQHQAQQPPQIQTQTQHLPHQVTTPAAPSPVSSLPSFGIGAPGLHHHLQQQQQAHLQQQPPVLQSHSSHLHNQSMQLGGGQQLQGLGGVGVGSGQQAQAQQHLPYNSSQHQPQLPAHLGGGVGAGAEPQHPSIAAQSAYFRGAQDVVTATSPYGGFHAPTPPHQQSQLDHTGSYTGFAPLAAAGSVGGQQQQQAQQSSHLAGSGFGTSPAAGDYGGYDTQTRGFYDSYGQGSGFQSRSQLGGHEDPAKASLPPSNLSSALPAQQTPQGQAGSQNAGGQQAGQFGMMPYYHYQQPYFHPLPTHQYNPYANPQNPYSKYVPPYTQPPSGPGGPPPPQQAGSKPPTATAASPYGTQSHLHYPSQNSPYDDPSTGAGSYQTNAGSDYGKQQALYSGQGLGNFYGGGQSVPGVQQNGGGQLGSNGTGSGGQAQRTAGGGAGVASVSPENPYKPYAGPGVGVSAVADKVPQQQAQQGRGSAAGVVQGASGAVQTQQGGYYPNRYSNQPQPATQGYPQSDGQFYPSYQQPRQYWS